MKKFAIALLSIACAFVAFTTITACDKKADSAAPAAAAADANANANADKAANGVTGKWKHEDGYVYEFNADGTGSYTADGSDPMKFTYKADNGKLSITYEGSDPMDLDYELKDNVLNVKDSLGKDTLYNRI